jgi:hypothetical protein
MGIAIVELNTEHIPHVTKLHLQLWSKNVSSPKALGRG